LQLRSTSSVEQFGQNREASGEREEACGRSPAGPGALLEAWCSIAASVAALGRTQQALVAPLESGLPERDQPGSYIPQDFGIIYIVSY
jgi:hypothetical protein